MKAPQRKEDWYVWGEWPGIPWFHGCFNYAIALELSKRSGIPITNFAADYREGTQRVYLLEHEWKEGGKMYLQKILKNQSSLIKALEDIEVSARKLKIFSSKLRRFKVSSLTLNQVSQQCRRFHHLNHELWSAGMVPNLLELNQGYLSGYLREYINKQSKSDISVDDWQILITPTKQSSAQREEFSFLLIVSKISKDGNLRRKLIRGQNDISCAVELVKSSAVWPAVRRHHQKYKWLQFGWTGPDSSVEQLVGRITALLHEGSVSEYLKKRFLAEQALSKRQKLLQASIRFDKQHRQLLQLLHSILFLKTERMDALYEGYSAFDPVFREIAKRLSFSLNQLYMVYLGNLEQAIKTKSLDSEKINSRLGYSAYRKEDGRLEFYVGKQAQQKMKSIISCLPKVKQTYAVSGECGYPGKVRGVIRFVPTSQDMQKVKAGDILLSQATDPSFLPAMKKAAAFITDLGGLTAHAAIVAREMKKPCVVGTKIATKIFKDGDVVEVDATNGTVRKVQ